MPCCFQLPACIPRQLLITYYVKEIKSLYRTYRPKTFDQVIGQDHIVKILKNQIAANKVSHAYLFCGSRGTGKTTVAKIFARTVSAASPDEQKKASFLVHGDLDIFEIDAASNNSVQDVRDIIEKVKYPPVNSKYKVYIIDEVHMFSGSAFNAFLKTLEDTPSHIIFILCTTEPHKILPTVQSRCLRFDFRPACEKDIQKVLTTVLKKENVAATDDAIKLITAAACGSYRDALSFAETVISYSGTQITADDAAQVLGTVAPETLTLLLNQIKEKKINSITKTCDTIFQKGININLLIKNFLEIIKKEFITGPAGQPQVGHIFKIFSELELSIKNSLDPKTHFENTCLLACVQKEQ